MEEIIINMGIFRYLARHCRNLRIIGERRRIKLAENKYFKK